MHIHSFQLVSLSLQRVMRLMLAASCCLVFSALTQAQSYSYDFVVRGTSGPSWVGTGLYIEPNSVLQLSATGEVDVSAGWGIHGPEGTERDQCAPVGGYPAAQGRCYGLVARITADASALSEVRGRWTYRDSEGYFSAPLGGYLWLTVNDDNPGDNTGSFQVHVELTTFPPDTLLCQNNCTFDKITRDVLLNYDQPRPDPKAFQGLLALNGLITAVDQSGGETVVSVSQGTVLAKYGDLPNLKVVFEKDTAGPAPALSKESVIQGLVFENKKASLITGASRLELYSKMPDKLGQGSAQLITSRKPSVDVISKNGILGTPAVMSGEPLIVRVNNAGSAQPEALVLQIDEKNVARVDHAQKVFEYVDKLTQWTVGRHVVALVAQGTKGPQTLWVTSFLVAPNILDLQQKEPSIPETKPSTEQTKADNDEKPTPKELGVKATYLKETPSQNNSQDPAVRISSLTNAIGGPSLTAKGQFVACPVKETRTEVTTPLPQPWWNTPQVGRLERVRVQTIGGNRTLVCEYWAYGRRVSIMRNFPDNATGCSAEGSGFSCR